MITQDHFLKKISELAHMRCLTITPASAKHISGRFEEFEPSDFDQAVEAIMMETEKFDFVRLFRRIVHSRADRLESESRFNRIDEGKAAKDFFNESIYRGECTRHVCDGCDYVLACKTRGKEWIKGINIILENRSRPKGEGKKMAQELINYMTNEFMGGIK